LTRKIIIDTDPGQDDAVAILLALASPEEVEVLGITAVAGNVPLALTETERAHRLRTGGAAGHGRLRGLRRAAGTQARHRRIRPRQDRARRDRAAGADHAPAGAHAVDFLIETLRGEPSDTVTLCPLGPLTNIAMAFQRAPDIVGRVQEIVLMGGAYFEVGNVTPAAEFNIYVDPEAAAIVFGSGVPITVMPLDVTHKVADDAAPDRRLPRARDAGGRGRGQLDRFLRALRHGEIRPRRRAAARSLRHRASGAARPLLRAARQRGDRDAIGPHARHDRGRLVGRDRPGEERVFMGDVDADGFYDLLTGRLARL
jgi:purine nucleosidase